MWYFEKCRLDEPVQPPVKLRNSKCCSDSSLINSHTIFKRLKALNIMRSHHVSQFDLDIVNADNCHDSLSEVGYSGAQKDESIPPTAIMNLQM